MEEAPPKRNPHAIAKRRNRVAHQVQRYIEHVWPHFERVSSKPELPMDRKAKGETNPPLPESAIALMDANREVSDLIRTDIEAVEASPMSHGGKEFRAIIRDIRYDAGVITNWRAGKSVDDQLKAIAFWKLCQFVADLLVQRDPDLDAGRENLWVVTSITDAFTADPRKLGDNTKRRWGKEHSFREIMAHLELVEAEFPEKDRKDCIPILRERLREDGKEVSYWRVRDAAAFVEAERKRSVVEALNSGTKGANI